MAKVKHVVDNDGKHYGYRMPCPGCGEEHVIPTLPKVGGWVFNGSETEPTFSPSILNKEVRRPDGSIGIVRCHAFVRGGFWEFLPDCGHPLASKRVEMVEVDP